VCSCWVPFGCWLQIVGGFGGVSADSAAAGVGALLVVSEDEGRLAGEVGLAGQPGCGLEAVEQVGEFLAQLAGGAGPGPVQLLQPRLRELLALD
jgi:hypothetical protein